MAIAGSALSSSSRDGVDPRRSAADARARLAVPSAVGGLCTTDSDHDNPISGSSATRIVDGPNQLWVADITNRDRNEVRSIWPQFLRLLTPRSRYAIVADRCPRCCCGTEGGHPSKTAAEGLHPSLGSWFAIRLRALSPPAGRTWSRRLYGPTWQSL